MDRPSAISQTLACGAINQSLKIERFCLCAIFFGHGAVWASWAARIPEIQQNLGLSNGRLGISMLCLAFGSVIAMPTAGLLGKRFGSIVTTRLFTLAYCVALPFLAWAPDWYFFGLACFCFGLMQGGMDVAMNAHAVAVERAYGRNIMSSFHALYSLGGMFGAALAYFAALKGVAPFNHFAGFIVATLPLMIIMLKPLHSKDGSETQGESAPFALSLPERGVIALSLIGFCSFVGEGSVSDWSAVNLHQTLHAPDSVATLGYVAFSVSMFCFRIFGDWLVHKLGDRRILVISSLLATAASAGVLLSSNVVLTISLYVLIGAGYSVMVPVVFSAAGRAARGSASVAIAGVATVGYVGFLFAPPIIGMLSDMFGLRTALLMPVLLTAAILPLALVANLGDTSSK